GPQQRKRGKGIVRRASKGKERGGTSVQAFAFNSTSLSRKSAIHLRRRMEVALAIRAHSSSNTKHGGTRKSNSAHNNNGSRS
ncbi:unnamed protein product, partial [Sphacelaria rigidula]